MTTADANTAGASGSAALGVSVVHGLSTATTSWAHTPLKLLTPRARGESVWAYTSSFGGGMVAGDRTRLGVTVDAGARCFLGSQASTKIYRNPAQLPCSHELTANIGDDALFILAPDPVQCFAESIYEQRQNFVLGTTGNLLLIDWMSAGRAARGEHWQFRRFLSRNEVQRNGKRILVDALRMDAADGALTGKYRGGRFQCFATLALLGPRLSEHSKTILEWCGAQPIQPDAAVIFAASPLHEGVIVRFAGTSVEQVGRAIHGRLGFVRELLDDDPFSRKW